MVKATQTHTHLKVQTSNTIVRLIPTIKNHLFKESQTPLQLDLTMRPFWFNMCAAGRHPHSCVRTWLGPDTPLKRERKRSHSLRWSDLFGNIFLCFRFDKYLFVLCQVAPGQPHCSLPAGREGALHCSKGVRSGCSLLSRERPAGHPSSSLCSASSPCE